MMATHSHPHPSSMYQQHGGWYTQTSSPPSITTRLQPTSRTSTLPMPSQAASQVYPPLPPTWSHSVHPTLLTPTIPTTSTSLPMPTSTSIPFLSSTSTSSTLPSFSSYAPFTFPSPSPSTAPSSPPHITHMKRCRSFDLTLDEMMIPRKRNRVSMDVDVEEIDATSISSDGIEDENKIDVQDIEIDEKPVGKSSALLSLPASEVFALVPYTGPLDDDSTSSSTYSSLRLNPALITSTSTSNDKLRHILNTKKTCDTRALVLYQPPPTLKSTLEDDASSQESVASDGDVDGISSSSSSTRSRPRAAHHDVKVNALCRAMSESIITTPVASTIVSSTSTSTSIPFQFGSATLSTTTATSQPFAFPSSSTPLFPSSFSFSAPSLSTFSSPSPSTSLSASPSTSPFTSPNSHKRRYEPIDVENDVAHPIRRLRLGDEPMQ